MSTIAAVWLGTIAVASSALAQSETRDASCRVLIVTGEDRHHDWRRTTPVLVELLHQDSRFRVDVLSDLTVLSDVRLEAYGAVVIHFKNETPEVPGRDALNNLRRYVAQGGGLVLVHFACGAFQEYKAPYTELVGRVWFGIKPPRDARMAVTAILRESRPRNRLSPITLPANFGSVSILYILTGAAMFLTLCSPRYSNP